MWRIWWAPNNASRWKMGFNLAFKGLILAIVLLSAVSLWQVYCTRITKVLVDWLMILLTDKFKIVNTGLFKMIVGVLTNCHTQYTWDRSICFFYSIEQHSTFLLHTLQVFYMCTLCDSANINTIMKCKHTKRLFTAVRRHISKLRSKRRNA